MNFITKTVEKKLGVDLNGDGMIGSNHGHTGSYQSHTTSSGGLINQLEKVVQADLNGDGRIGGSPAYFTNSYQQSGQGNFSNQNQYSTPPYNSYARPNGAIPQNHPSGGLINQLEKVAHMDLNGDGRIGNNPLNSSSYHPQYSQNNFPNYHQTNGPQNFNQYDSPPNPFNNNSFSSASGPSQFNPYSSSGGPTSYHQQTNGGNEFLNQYEKVVQMDLNGDGFIGDSTGHTSNFY